MTAIKNLCNENDPEADVICMRLANANLSDWEKITIQRRLDKAGLIVVSAENGDHVEAVVCDPWPAVEAMLQRSIPPSADAVLRTARHADSP